MTARIAAARRRRTSWTRSTATPGRIWWRYSWTRTRASPGRRERSSVVSLHRLHGFLCRVCTSAPCVVTRESLMSLVDHASSWQAERCVDRDLYRSLSTFAGSADRVIRNRISDSNWRARRRKGKIRETREIICTILPFRSPHSASSRSQGPASRSKSLSLKKCASLRVPSLVFPSARARQLKIFFNYGKRPGSSTLAATRSRRKRDRGCAR